jgi:hypothetical protein
MRSLYSERQCRLLCILWRDMASRLYYNHHQRGLPLHGTISTTQVPSISSDTKAAVKDAQTGVNSAVDKFVGQF